MLINRPRMRTMHNDLYKVFGWGCSCLAAGLPAGQGDLCPGRWESGNVLIANWWSLNENPPVKEQGGGCWV